MVDNKIVNILVNISVIRSKFGVKRSKCVQILVFSAQNVKFVVKRRQSNTQHFDLKLKMRVFNMKMNVF